MAMCETAKEAELLRDLGSSLCTAPIPVADNQGALAIAQNPIFQPSSTYIKRSLPLYMGSV